MDQAELIARGEGAYALARRWPARRGFECDPDGWRRLLKVAKQESEHYSPASAAVWEALWRDDPYMTPEAWLVSGPQPPESEPLNPFLHARSYIAREATLALSDFDRQAGSLLDAAIRAESVPRWWDTSRLLADYNATCTEFSQFVHASSREDDSITSSPGGRWESTPFPPDLQSQTDRLEDIQLALTRSLLIGHPATTEQILPPLLASIKAEAGTLLFEQTRIVRFAMQRFGTSRRVLAGARSAVGAAGPSRMRRLRHGEYATPAPTASRPTTMTAILLGTLLGRSPSTRRHATRNDSISQPPTGLDA